MRHKQAFILTALLLVMVLIAAGCSRSSTTTPVATAPENGAAQNSEPATPPAGGTVSQEPAANSGTQSPVQPQPTVTGEDKKPASTPTTAPAQAASLVLGKNQAQNGEITEIATTFKAGEKFYYRFDNGGAFGVDKLTLQYADPATGTVINQYGIYVDSTSRYDSATMSFKTPGAYKIIILINGVERASKVVIIE